MRRAILYEPVDRLPAQINYTDGMGEKLAAHLGVSLEALPERLGNHLRRVDLPAARRKRLAGDVIYDWWGVGWSTETEGYWPVDSPLAENDDLNRFAWPDPQEAGLMEEAQQIITADSGRHFIVPNFGFALYERAWSLRGFENFNLDLATRPDYAGELLERITVIQEGLARRFLVLGVDGGYFGDDYGAQKHMLFSPRAWRSLFKPRLKRLFDVFREAGLPVLMHSDGDIAAILPDLVEIGLTTLNPVQPEVLDLDWLRRIFGGRLSFYGGVSTQTVLPYSTPAEVKGAARRAVEALAPEGTGLVLAPSHRMTADIPMQNVDAFLEALEEIGGGG